MKNFLLDLSVTTKIEKKISTFRGMTAKFSEEIMPHSLNMYVDEKIQHQTSLFLENRFFCNSSDYDRASNLSARMIVNYVYGGIIKELYNIQHAAMAGDVDDVMKRASDLIEELKRVPIPKKL